MHIFKLELPQRAAFFHFSSSHPGSIPDLQATDNENRRSYNQPVNRLVLRGDAQDLSTHAAAAAISREHVPNVTVKAVHFRVKSKTHDEAMYLIK
jgi:hypothetical protein